PYFGVSVVGHDLNAPTTHFVELDRNVDLALAFRPTGRASLQIGIEDRYYDASGQWIPRATLGFDIPYVGRVRGDVTLSDPTLGGTVLYTATAGLEVGVGTASVEGGGIWGSGVGGSNGAGYYLGAAITGYRSPGLPEGSYALKIRIDETPGPRRHVALLRQLWRLARDPDLKAVALMLKAEPADSLAHAEEFGDAIRM